MTSKVPKSRTKGCFQCSKRRIDCDLGQPQCKKCAKKDLECSGLGRIRFVQGVASRGKLKGSKIPTLPAVMVREDVEVDIEGNPCPCPAPYEKPIPRTAPTHNSNDGYDLLRQDEPKFFGIAANQDPGTSPFNPRISGGYVVTQQMQSCAQLSLQPWLPPIGHHARMLMSHCRFRHRFNKTLDCC